MSESRFFLVRVSLIYLPRAEDDKPAIMRVGVELPAAVESADEAALEQVFEAAKAAVVKGYILKGQRAQIDRVSIEVARRMPGKPIDKPLALPKGIIACLLGEERAS